MGKEKKLKKIEIVKIKPARKEGSEEPESSPDTSRSSYVESASSSSGWNCNSSQVRSTFIRGLAVIYFCAFLSIYLQIDGLYGSNGVTPVKAELQLDSRTPDACFQDKWSILCYIPHYLGIDSQHAMELTALVGVVVSAVALMCVHMCITPVFAILWLLYFSIYNVGNVFMWFQWDILLLETGILGIIAAPWLPSKKLDSKPRDLLSLWMVKWLLFRLMFASGVVKLSSGCPTWWGLTALQHHFETQCLPTPLAYYAHQLPSWVLRLGVVITYNVEIVVPFAFFGPFALLRKFSFWCQVLFQLGIIATGNYNFFNLLTIVLCASLLEIGSNDDKKKKQQQMGIPMSKVFVRSFSISLISISLYYVVKHFGITIEGQTLATKVLFKPVEWNSFVSMAVPYSIALGFLTLISTICQTVIISLVDIRGTWNKITSLFSVLFYGVICLALFSLTLVPFSSLHKETNQAIPEQIREAYVMTNKFHLTSAYGLFRRMTGTDGGRPEVILEYANDLKGPWKEYDFLYKPGNVSAAPAFIVPHQPRLDWQTGYT